MAFVVSNWKITFDPGGANNFACVNWGDEIDDEITFPWSQRVDTSKPMRAASAIKFGRGAVEMGFTLGVWKNHASHAAARNYLLEHAASVPTGVAKNLRIEVSGGNTYQLSTCVISGGDGHMIKAVGVIRTWVQYKFEGGSFVKL